MVPILVSRFAAFSLADTHFDRRSTMCSSGICSCSSSKAAVGECRLPPALVVPAKSIGANGNNEFANGHPITSTCTLFRSSCAVCDVMPPVRGHHVVSPRDLPHREHLRAADNLRKNKRVMSEFRGYPNDPGGLLDGLVLSVHWVLGRRRRRQAACVQGLLQLCIEKYIPETALANVFGSVTCHASSTEPRRSSVQLPMQSVRKAT